MAIAVDASTPARATSTTGLTVTTASFTPPAGSLLLACVHADTVSAGATPTATMSGNAGLTWANVGFSGRTQTGNNGYAGMFWAKVTTSAAMTVTITMSGASASLPTSLKVYVLTGADTTTPAVTSVTGGATTQTMTATGMTVASKGGLFFAVGSEWQAIGPGGPTSSDLTADAVFASGTSTLECISGYKTLPTLGASVTGDFTAGSTGTKEWNYVAIQVAVAVPVLVGTPTAASTTGASVAVTAPAGLAVGDYQLIIAAMAGLNSADTPAGWALLAMVENNSDTGPFRTYFFTNDSDTASVTVSKPGATAMHVVRAAWRGGTGFNANSQNALPVQPAGTGQLQNTTHALPPCTTKVAESLVVAVAHVDSASAATTFTMAGWNERYDAAVFTGRSVALYDIAVASPSTQNGTLTLSRSDFINMLTIELLAGYLLVEGPRNSSALSVMTAVMG